jgi:hypothetical protein
VTRLLLSNGRSILSLASIRCAIVTLLNRKADGAHAVDGGTASPRSSWLAVGSSRGGPRDALVLNFNQLMDGIHELVKQERAPLKVVDVLYESIKVAGH